MNDLRAVVMRLLAVEAALEDKAVASQPDSEEALECAKGAAAHAYAESCFAPSEASDA